MTAQPEQVLENNKNLKKGLLQQMFV